MLKRLSSIRDRNEDGFTMVELMVVVAILGILTAISIPIFLNQKKSGMDESVEADLRTAALWVETWKNQNPNTKIPVITLQNTDGTGVTKPAATGDFTSVKGPLAQIKISKGTELSTSPGAWGAADDATAPPGTFTLKATNSKGKKAASANGIQYSSATKSLIK